MNSQTVIMSAAALMASVIAHPAYANKYGIVMAGCVPTDATIQADRYRTGGHGVFIKGSGTARFLCAIPITGGEWKSVDVYYKDPDGTGPDYEVKAFLKVSNFGSTVGNSLCGVSSNAKAGSEYTSMRCEFSEFSPSSSKWYWVEIQIFRRTGLTQEIEVLGVNIN
jgi:hypothetical protein